jgi:hypothetical protein
MDERRPAARTDGRRSRRACRGHRAEARHLRTGTIRAIVSGTGQIHVAGDEGSTLATMVAEGGEAAFSIRNKGGTTIVRIGETSAGGVLQLADQAAAR